MIVRPGDARRKKPPTTVYIASPAKGFLFAAPRLPRTVALASDRLGLLLLRSRQFFATLRRAGRDASRDELLGF
jgi:hypothetical protein